MPPRPDNHVTREQEAVRQACMREATATWPEVPEDLLLHLEAAFPPRCYDHRGESLEDHLVYAGRVGLVEAMRSAFEQQRKEALEADPEEGDTSVDLDHPDTEG